MMRTGWVVAIILVAGSAFAQQAKFASPCDSSEQKLSPTGKHVAVYCKDQGARIVETASGRVVVNVPRGKNVTSSAFSTDGSRFAAGMSDGSVSVWRLDKPSVPKQWSAGAVAVDVVAFVPNTNLVAVGMHMRAGAVWDISATPAKKASLDVDFDGLTSIAGSPDGKWVVTTGADTVVRLYETKTWKKTAEYRDLKLEPFAAAFTTDGKYAVIGGADRQLTLLDPATGKAARQLAVESDPINEIVPVDGDRLAVVYFDADGLKPSHVMAWKLSDGSSRAVSGGEGVTGGGVANGQMWFIRANAKDIEVVAGN